MIIGVPKEIKDKEYRVSITPGGVASLIHGGHRVLVETNAGLRSGFKDEDYARSGATICDTASQVFEGAELVVKVKEPLPVEFDLLRPGMLLFTYLHLAAAPQVAQALCERGVTGIAYETVGEGKRLPLLTPMSEIAGRMAVQIGAHYLESPHGGRGVLLGGVPGVRAGSVVIIGGGVVGTNAAQIALGLGARVTVIDIDLDRLRYLDQVMHGSLNTVASNRRNIQEAVRRAELLIGAVLIPGAKAPQLVSEEMIASMATGSVVLDVSVDQGGCIETIHVTSHSEPTYLCHDVVHYAVPNMPGAVPRTATYALSNATLLYITRLADWGLEDSIRQDQALARGVNVVNGKVTHPSVADALDLPYVPLEQALQDD